MVGEDGGAHPWYDLGEVPSVQAEAWGNPPAQSPRSGGRVPAAFPALPTAAVFVDFASPVLLTVGLKGQSQKAAACVPCQSGDASLPVLYVNKKPQLCKAISAAAAWSCTRAARSSGCCYAVPG